MRNHSPFDVTQQTKTMDMTKQNTDKIEKRDKRDADTEVFFVKKEESYMFLIQKLQLSQY
jgi:hypothetical protein